MTILEKMAEGLKVYGKLEDAEVAIKGAAVGETVDAGTARGLRIFGRRADLLLRMVIRK